MKELESKPSTFKLKYVGLLYLNCFGDIMELYDCEVTEERYGRKNGSIWYKL